MATLPRLPRTPLLGAQLATPGFSERGMHVAAVRAGSMADEAGVVAGDLVTRVGAVEVRSQGDLRRALRACSDHPSVTLTTTRGTGQAAVQPRPSEVHEGSSVTYGELSRDGVRLRTILTRPAVTPAPVVLILPGIGAQSIDFGPSLGSPMARLVCGLAAAGLATLRVERRGLGDSEGENPGFRTEVGDACAAATWLAAEPWVERVIVFGHSVGGMIAPYVPADARVVYGTAATRWYACLEASSRRQLALRQVPPDAIEATIAEEQQLLREAPVSFERTREFHAELDASDLAAAWSASRAPTCVLAGEHDWVVGADEQVEVARLARGEHHLLPRLDHAFTLQPSSSESLIRYGAGVFGDQLVKETAAFIGRLLRGGAIG